VAIELECPDCSRKYRLKDGRAGKRFRCKVCAAVIAVPAAGEIFTHEERSSGFTLAIGDVETIERLTAHIEQHIGPIEMVFHEIVSDLVHLDIHWIKATAARPFHVLVTTGMSDRPMTTPPGAADYAYAELAIALPDTWPMEQSEWENPANYWPIGWLTRLARFPHEYSTWLAISHSVPNGDPPEPFDDSTELCGWLIGPPFFLDGGIPHCAVDELKTVRFYGLIPLYREEMELKVAHGIDALLERFEQQLVPLEVLDPRRPNVCRKVRGR
jgi:ribosomal protein S27E